MCWTGCGNIGICLEGRSDVTELKLETMCSSGRTAVGVAVVVAFGVAVGVWVSNYYLEGHPNASASEH